MKDTRQVLCSAFLVFSLLVSLLAGLLLTPATPAAAEGPTIHVVQRGETLTRIALRYGVTVNDIVRANGLANPNRIYTGQRLIIPLPTGPALPPLPAVHVVRPGDTLYSIALYYGVSIRSILIANGLSNPDFIWVGQRLVIPAESSLQPPPQTTFPNERYFPETGKWVRSGFLEFFNRYGGVALFGLPLTNELSDGGMTVQYFQNFRLEWHPEASSLAERVQLTPLGSRFYGNPDPAVAPLVPGDVYRDYFPVTGHSVGFAFRDFFRRWGGVYIFGYPLTEEKTENGITVQWFQKARFEWVPPNPAGFQVRLTPLGHQAHAGQPAGSTPPGTGTTPSPTVIDRFGRIWQENPAVASKLVKPLAAQFGTWMAEQPFQKGVMLWRQDNIGMYVLYADGTWDSAEQLYKKYTPLTIVTPKPPEGLYVPQRGFGQLWHEFEQVRRIGWATQPEHGFDGLLQTYEGGLMIWTDIPRIYVLFSDGTWRSFADPGF